MVNPTAEHHGFIVPSVSLTSQLTIENDDDDELEEYSRERSRSFMESMQENVPSHARIPSPKLHRKHSRKEHKDGQHSGRDDPLHRSTSEHNHRHHKHRSPRADSPLYRSQTSPLLRRKALLLETNKAFLDPSLFTGRPRSNSDSESKEEHLSSKRLSSSWGGEDLRRARSKSSSYPEVHKANGECKKFYIDTDGDDDDDDDDETLHHRKSIADTKPSTDSDKTLTRRTFEMLSIGKKVEKDSCKRKTLKMIDELYSQCDSNYAEVESQINFAFLRLSNALNARRQELIDDATKMCERKKAALTESRAKCLQCRECEDVCKNDLTNGYDNENGSRRNSSSLGSVDDHDEVLQCNGILEPWKSDDGDVSDIIDLNDVVNGDTHTNGEAMNNTLRNLNLPADIFADVLEEGNLSFLFNEEISEQFNSIGVLKEELSSSQFSFAKGLCKAIAITGETVYFEIHTRDHTGHPTYSKKDKIKVEVFDSQNEKVDIVMNNMNNNRKSWMANGGWQFPTSPYASPAVSPSSSHTSIGSRFYAPCFTPQQDGEYNIHIRINDVELASSPMMYTVYPKMDLTFDMVSQVDRLQHDIASTMIKLNSDLTDTERRRQMMRRESSEDSDWQDSHWIRQKGDKSTLLRSNEEIPSVIYAATIVTGVCAWKLRVTSACSSLTLSVGVGTRTGIPDIDEHFVCDYSIGKENEEEEDRKLARRVSLRRVSSFTRVSLTYCILLNTTEGTVRVISENSNEDKTTEISQEVLEKSRLYPFVSMIHHHQTCFMQVCPRPQITIL